MLRLKGRFCKHLFECCFVLIVSSCLFPPWYVCHFYVGDWMLERWWWRFWFEMSPWIFLNLGAKCYSRNLLGWIDWRVFDILILLKADTIRWSLAIKFYVLGEWGVCGVVVFILVFVRLCNREYLIHNICGCHIVILQANYDWILCFLLRMGELGCGLISVVCCSLVMQLEGKLVLDLYNIVDECVRNSVACDNSLTFCWFCLLSFSKL